MSWVPRGRRVDWLGHNDEEWMEGSKVSMDTVLSILSSPHRAFLSISFTTFCRESFCASHEFQHREKARATTAHDLWDPSPVQSALLHLDNAFVGGSDAIGAIPIPAHHGSFDDLDVADCLCHDRNHVKRTFLFGTVVKTLENVS